MTRAARTLEQRPAATRSASALFCWSADLQVRISPTAAQPPNIKARSAYLGAASSCDPAASAALFCRSVGRWLALPERGPAVRRQAAAATGNSLSNSLCESLRSLRLCVSALEFRLLRFTWQHLAAASRICDFAHVLKNVIAELSALAHCLGPHCPTALLRAGASPAPPAEENCRSEDRRSQTCYSRPIRSQNWSKR